jgi:aerobic carbon-monoxide dehydrogenase medium subunit
VDGKMKPPAFTYHRPETREEVDELLARLGDDCKILAGGQSLIPILNMRLATPANVVDINGLKDEPSDPVAADGEIVTGALVRQESAERSALVTERVPLLAEAMPYVAHPAIRTRGTVAGSVAHSDPAAEVPAVLTVLGASVVARSKTGTRIIRAADLFAGPLENSLEAGEWLQEVRWPTRSPGWGYAFEEFARRRGDYALCGVAAAARREGDGAAVALSYLGMGDVPERLETEALGDRDDVDDAVAALVSDHLDAPADIHASPQYRMHLARKLGARAARRAIASTGSDD